MRTKVIVFVVKPHSPQHCYPLVERIILSRYQIPMIIDEVSTIDYSTSD